MRRAAARTEAIGEPGTRAEPAPAPVLPALGAAQHSAEVGGCSALLRKRKRALWRNHERRMAGGVHERAREEEHPRPPCVDRQRAAAARGEETGPWDVKGDRLGRVTQIRQAELQRPLDERPSIAEGDAVFLIDEHVHAHVERTASADGEVGSWYELSRRTVRRCASYKR